MDLSSSKHSLFQAHRSYGNVVLNFQYAVDHELGCYAQAFHKAGQALTEQMLARASYNGLEACPIVFLYRHTLELYLKAIALIGDEIMQLKGRMPTNRKRLFTTHRLLPLFPLLKQTFEAVGWTWELEIDGLRTYEDVEDLLRDFETVDPNSYTLINVTPDLTIVGRARCRFFMVPSIPSIGQHVVVEELAVVDAAEKLKLYLQGKYRPTTQDEIQLWRNRFAQWNASQKRDG